MATVKAERQTKKLAAKSTRQNSAGGSDTASVKRESLRRSSRASTSSPASTKARREVHSDKDAITKGALKKASANKTKQEAIKAAIKKAAAKAKAVESSDPPNNGRHEGRKLVRWGVYVDQLVLLCMEYELKKNGVEIPYDAVARRLSIESNTTGKALGQHLNKLRKLTLLRGAWVPPLPGRSNAQKSGEARGYVRCKDKNGEEYEREVGWDEDVSMLINPVDIEATRLLKEGPVKFSGNTTSPATLTKAQICAAASTYRLTKAAKKITSKTKEATSASSDENVDMSLLESDPEFDPHTTKKTKRVTRASAKRAILKEQSPVPAESDTEGEFEFIVPEDKVVKVHPRMMHRMRMMPFNDSDEEEIGKKMITMQGSPEMLSKFPAGIAGGFTVGSSFKVPVRFSATRDDDSSDDSMTGSDEGDVFEGIESCDESDDESSHAEGNAVSDTGVANSGVKRELEDYDMFCDDDIADTGADLEADDYEVIYDDEVMSEHENNVTEADWFNNTMGALNFPIPAADQNSCQFDNTFGSFENNSGNFEMYDNAYTGHNNANYTKDNAVVGIKSQEFGFPSMVPVSANTMTQFDHGVGGSRNQFGNFQMYGNVYTGLGDANSNSGFSAIGANGQDSGPSIMEPRSVNCSVGFQAAETPFNPYGDLFNFDGTVEDVDYSDCDSA